MKGAVSQRLSLMAHLGALAVFSGAREVSCVRSSAGEGGGKGEGQSQDAAVMTDSWDGCGGSEPRHMSCGCKAWLMHIWQQDPSNAGSCGEGGEAARLAKAAGSGWQQQTAEAWCAAPCYPPTWPPAPLLLPSDPSATGIEAHGAGVRRRQRRAGFCLLLPCG